MAKAAHRAFGKMKIRYKLILAIYLVLLPALIACSVILYNVNYRATMKETSELYERFTQNACEEIKYLQQDAIDILTYFAVNDEVHALLTLAPGASPGSPLFWYEETPVDFLQNILAIKSHIKTLVLYPENGIAPFYISRDASVHQAQMGEIRALDIYENALNASGDIMWTRVDAGRRSIYEVNKSNKIVAYRELYNISKNMRLAFVAIGMDAREYTRICAKALQEDNEGMVVLDSTGAELVRTGSVNEEALARLRDDAALRRRLAVDGTLSLQENGCYIFGARSSESGVQVFYFSPQENWTAKTRQTLYLPIILALVLLISAIPLSTVIARTISRGIDQLMHGMECFRKGDFSEQVTVRGNDEIAVLSQAFNDMVRDIRMLVDKNYVMALRERESELNALQAQINPHFLYNVMDSLYWQAEGADNEALAENILALSHLFRLLLSQGKSEIAVEQEAELVRSYLQIQKMRFGDRLTYVVQIDGEMLEYAIPKLTLQPFVENAIVHGLEVQAKGGVVSVSGYLEDDYLMFNIEDNGAGMPQDEADRILLAADGDRYAGARVGHYAIRNIKERLTLRYGDDYRLEILSAPGKGTCVRIGIPAQRL